MCVRACRSMPTNAYRSFPTPDGLIPGAGSILALSETATDVKATVIGKPSPFMMVIAMERMGLTKDEVLVIGELQTDIAGGQAVKAHTALVLSGVTTPEQAKVLSPSLI